MSIAEMKEYLEMCMKGASTIPERKVMLTRKQCELKEKLATLQKAIDYIDWKQQFYDDVQSGKIPYRSNLIPSSTPSDEAEAS